MGFGDSALNFQLRVWTDRYDSWGAVQSDLYLAVYRRPGGRRHRDPVPAA